MTGESMDFDTRTGKGRMVGKVRMIIHNIDAMGGEKSKEQPKATTPAAAKKSPAAGTKGKQDK